MLQGQTYDQIAEQFRVTKSTVSKSVADLARDLQSVVGVIGIDEDSAPTAHVIRAHGKDYLEALEHFVPLANPAGTTSPSILTERHIDQLVLHTARHSRCKQRDIALLLMLIWRTMLDARIALANQRIVSFEKLCHHHGITELASYDIEPLAIEAKVFSMFGRRLLELISKVDQLMPMLETLCIDEVLPTSQLIAEKSQIKKTVRAVTAATRALSLGLLKRINALPVSERKSTAPNSQTSPGEGSARHPTFKEAPQQSGAPEPNAAPESVVSDPATEMSEETSASP